jgi:hypothetical protein
MKPTPFSMFFDLSRLAFESNMVIGLRMMKLAAGGPKAISEANLMTSEKLQAASSVMIDGAFALASGKSMESIGKSTVAHYRKKVRANHRRLSK